MWTSSVKSMFLALFLALSFALAGTATAGVTPDTGMTQANAQEVGSEPIHAFGDDDEDEEDDEDEDDEEEETW